MVYQLKEDEIQTVQAFINEADAKAEGFRLGMNHAKDMFARYIIGTRKPLPEPEPEPATDTTA